MCGRSWSFAAGPWCCCPRLRRQGTGSTRCAARLPRTRRCRRTGIHPTWDSARGSSAGRRRACTGARSGRRPDGRCRALPGSSTRPRGGRRARHLPVGWRPASTVRREPPPAQARDDRVLPRGWTSSGRKAPRSSERSSQAGARGGVEAEAPTWLRRPCSPAPRRCRRARRPCASRRRVPAQRSARTRPTRSGARHPLPATCGPVARHCDAHGLGLPPPPCSR